MSVHHLLDFLSSQPVKAHGTSARYRAECISNTATVNPDSDHELSFFLTEERNASATHSDAAAPLTNRQIDTPGGCGVASSFIRIDHPDSGIDFETAAGQYLGAVVHHPRIEGAWMAMWKSSDPRDCGMKRYKTRAGAVRCVERAVAAKAEGRAP